MFGYIIIIEGGGGGSAGRVLASRWSKDPSICDCLLDGKRAVGGEVRVGRELKQLKASREVLPCSGALQSPSPRGLMLSGIGLAAQLQRHGLATVHDRPGVGKNLHGHISLEQVINASQLTDTFIVSFAGAVAAIKSFVEWRRQRSGMLTTHFAEAGGFIKSRPDKPLPNLQLHFVVGKLADYARKTPFGHGCSRHIFLLLPKRRGSAKLARADPTAAPLIEPNFFAERSDRDIVLRGFKRLRRTLARPTLSGLGGRKSRRWQRRGATRGSSSSSATTPTPNSIWSAAAAGARGHWPRRRPNRRCAACRACAWPTRRSCRGSSAATPTRRRS